MKQSCDSEAATPATLSTRVKKEDEFEECVKQQDPEFMKKRYARLDRTEEERDSAIDKMISCIETALQ